MADNNLAVAGFGGRIGELVLYGLSRRGIPVSVGSEIPNLDGQNTIDAVVRRMTRVDKAHGRLPWEVNKKNGDTLTIKLKGYNYDLKVLTANHPSDIDWKKEGITFVEEATGICLIRYSKEAESGRYGADVYFDNGVGTVLVSAPTKGEDANLVFGLNHTNYDPAKHHYVSDLSCTTKAVAFALAVLYDNGVYTRGKVVINVPHSATGKEHKNLIANSYDAGEFGIVESTSGAYESLSKIFNESGKPPKLESLEVLSLRISALDGSDAIIHYELYDETITAEKLKEMFREAARDPKYRGGLDVYEQNGFFSSRLVSSPEELHPISGNVPSSVINLSRIYEVGLNGRHMHAWFSNERGPAENQAGLTEHMLRKIQSQ